MKVVKILVDTHQQAQAVLRVLDVGEDTGALDFSFGVRVTEDMPMAQARKEFSNEQA